MVLVRVSHNAVEILIDLYLVRQILSDVAYEESIASTDEIDVLLIVYSDSVDSLLYDKKGDLLETEISD